MFKFVKLTGTDGQTIWVNLSSAIYMERSTSNEEYTEIGYTRDTAIRVVELPEDIFKLPIPLVEMNPSGL